MVILWQNMVKIHNLLYFNTSFMNFIIFWYLFHEPLYNLTTSFHACIDKSCPSHVIPGVNKCSSLHEYLNHFITMVFIIQKTGVHQWCPTEHITTVYIYTMSGHQQPYLKSYTSIYNYYYYS